MKSSYTLRTWGGPIVLLREILDQMNLPLSTVLHAVLAHDKDRGERDLIVSPLPLSSWDRTYRLIIYVASAMRSLAKVTDAIAREGINLISASSATASAAGEGCFTAVVEVPPEKQDDIQEFVKRIEKTLRAGGALSESALFDGKERLARVRIVKLRILSQFLASFGDGDRYTLRVENGSIDLGKLEGQPQGGYFDFLGQAAHNRKDSSDYVVLTPDTEERYLRISVLAGRDYRHLAVPLKLTGDPRAFPGCFTQVLNAIADQRINVINATNQLMVKRAPEVAGSSSLAQEEARFSFTLDLVGSKMPREINRARADLVSAIRQCLRTYEERGILTVNEQEIVFGPLETAPLVFLATNAKRGLHSRYLGMVRRLLYALRVRGLQPTNVDIRMTNDLRGEIERLASLCPIMVSLYLPETSVRLRKSSEHGEDYAASDYTIFEEAQALSKDQCVTKRLRHKKVYGARFFDDEITFGDEGFGKALVKLEEWLDRMMISDKFIRFRRECDQRKLQPDAVKEEWMIRDLEGWLSRSTNRRRRPGAARGVGAGAAKRVRSGGERSAR
jgi:ACT domain-containing protein